MLDQFRAQKLEWNRANNQIYDRVEANSGDSNGRTLFVQILNGGMVEDLTGAVLSLAWNKGAAQGLEAFDEVDAKKGQFRLFYPTGMLVNHGVLQASLVLVDVTGRIESKPFDIIVHKGTVDDEAVESDNKFTALTTALVKVSQVQAEFDSLYADKSLMMDTLKVEKSNEMDRLYDDKNQALTGLERDFADKAENLEQTYAPRLTGVETGLSDLENKVIVESGSNVNGSWTKFADGTMICRLNKVCSKPNTVVGSALYGSSSNFWEFPQVFLKIPSVTSNVISGATYAWTSQGSSETSVSGTSIIILHPSSGGANTNPLISLIAIGPWK